MVESLNRFRVPLESHPSITKDTGEGRAKSKNSTFMFTEMLLTVAKRREQPPCPLADEWINKHLATYNGIFLSLKREEKSDNATTWMNL